MAIDKRSRDCCCLGEGAKREKSAWFMHGSWFAKIVKESLEVAEREK